MKPKPEQEQDPVLARRAAMHCLARREHGVQELRAKLAAKGFAAAAVDEALAGLAGDRLLSDARFAEAFVHGRCQRGHGPQKIRAELRARGIDEHIVEDSIDGRDTDWLALARSVRERKYGGDPPADFRERSRQMRFLQQRGFSSEQIAAVFRDEE